MIAIVPDASILTFDAVLARRNRGWSEISVLHLGGLIYVQVELIVTCLCEPSFVDDILGLCIFFLSSVSSGGFLDYSVP